MYSKSQMDEHRENIKYWQQLGEKERCEAIIYSREAFDFMRNTLDNQEVIAKLTYDNCVTLTRRNK